jgi:chromosome segregation ATPase
MEQGFVNRAADRVDAARSKLLQVQTDLKLAAAHLSDVEDHLSGATDPVEQTRLKEEVGRAQGIVAALTAEEQSCSTALDDQQTKLRNAESDLDSTQDELNALIKRMAPAPSSPPTH